MSEPKATLKPVGVLRGEISLPKTLNEKYDGEYEFTPTEETQTVKTQNLILEKDITIKPIPSNYGRVSYDGVKLKIE